MITQPPRYLAYVLRLWQVGGEVDLVWRASLQRAYDGERHVFADLDALFALLKERPGVLQELEDPGRHPTQS